jgi:hypothetical protein
LINLMAFVLDVVMQPKPAGGATAFTTTMQDGAHDKYGPKEELPPPPTTTGCSDRFCLLSLGVCAGCLLTVEALVGAETSGRRSSGHGTLRFPDAEIAQDQIGN